MFNNRNSTGPDPSWINSDLRDEVYVAIVKIQFESDRVTKLFGYNTTWKRYRLFPSKYSYFIYTLLHISHFCINPLLKNIAACLIRLNADAALGRFLLLRTDNHMSMPNLLNGWPLYMTPCQQELHLLYSNHTM